MTDTPEADVPTPERRKPFHDEAMERGTAFLQQILEDIPELESLGLVFSYSVLNKDLPYAIVMGQSGPLRSPAEIVHMSMQLWRTLNYQLTNGYECIKQLAGFMGEQGQKLQQLQEQIDAKHRELAGLDAELTRRQNEAAGGPGS